MHQEKKRFIAGAICPKCKAIDSLAMCHAGENIIQECVVCGFTDEMRFDSPPGSMRENRNTEDGRDGSQPVKIIDPQSKSR